MFHHLGDAKLTPAKMLPEWWNLLSGKGGYGVNIFFVISGFVITRAVCQGGDDFGRLSLRDFYVRRVARIVPLLLFVLGIGVVALLVFPGTGSGSGPAPPGSALRFFLRGAAPLSIGFWISVFTFTFNWRRAFIGPYYHGLHWDVLWSLSVEEQFYAFYPLVLRRLRTRARLAMFLTMVLLLSPLVRCMAVGMSEALPYLGVLVTSVSSLGAGELIAMGGLLHLLMERTRDLPWIPGRPVNVALALFGVLGMLAASGLTSEPLFAPMALGCYFCLFLYGGLRCDWGQGRIGAALAYLGKLSYAAYLLHALALFLLWPLLNGRSLLVSIPVFTVVTFALSAAVHHALELPANRRIRKFFARGQRVTEPTC